MAIPLVWLTLRLFLAFSITFCFFVMFLGGGKANPDPKVGLMPTTPRFSPIFVEVSDSAAHPVRPTTL